MDSSILQSLRGMFIDITELFEEIFRINIQNFVKYSKFRFLYVTKKLIHRSNSVLTIMSEKKDLNLVRHNLVLKTEFRYLVFSKLENTFFRFQTN